MGGKNIVAIYFISLHQECKWVRNNLGSSEKSLFLHAMLARLIRSYLPTWVIIAVSGLTFRQQLT